MFVCLDVSLAITLLSGGVPCSTFGIIGKLVMRKCTCLSFYKFLTKGSNVIEFRMIFIAKIIIWINYSFFSQLGFLKIKLALTGMVLFRVTLDKVEYSWVNTRGPLPLSFGVAPSKAYALPHARRHTPHWHLHSLMGRREWLAILSFHIVPKHHNKTIVITCHRKWLTTLEALLSFRGGFSSFYGEQ